MTYRPRERERDRMSGRPLCRWCKEPLTFARFQAPDPPLPPSHGEAAVVVSRPMWRIPLEGPTQLNGAYIIQRGIARRLGSVEAREARDQGYDLYAYHDCPNAPQRRRRRLAER